MFLEKKRHFLNLLLCEESIEHPFFRGAGSWSDG